MYIAMFIGIAINIFSDISKANTAAPPVPTNNYITWGAGNNQAWGGDTFELTWG